MTMIPNNERTTLNEGTTLVYPGLHGWNQIKLDNEESVVRAQIRGIFRYDHRPWMTVDLISNSPLVETTVMNVLQQELDDTSCPDGYRTTCMKCLLALSNARNIVPSSFSSRNVVKEGTNPTCGGGFADIWKGRLHDTQVCLKVLRVFIPEKAREKLLRDFCQEALVWRQLRHPNILPFLGVSEDLFAPSYCLISPWMVNGNIMSYLEAHPDHDRLTSLVQVAEGMKYLHNHDPPIVHADIRGANILVMDDLCCCLADFGLSLFAESRALNSSSWMDNGCIRWLAPEYMDSNLFNQSYLTARDVYAYGCTVVEIFTDEPPFSNIKNDAGVIHEVLIKQSRPPRPPPNTFLVDELWELVIACLSTMPSQRPNVEKITEILAQLQTSSGLLFPDRSLNAEDSSFPFYPPGLVDQNLNECFVPFVVPEHPPPVAPEYSPLPPDTKPFHIMHLSSEGSHPNFCVSPNLDDELFAPWLDTSDLDAEKFFFTDYPPVLVDQNLNECFVPLVVPEYSPLPPDTEPFHTMHLSCESYQDSCVSQNLDDELFVPWPDRQNKTVIVPGVLQGDRNSDQGASPDINVPDGPKIIPSKVIPPDVIQCEGSPSTPATSTTEGEDTPTRQGRSAKQTTPSNGKRRRSSSPEELLASPSTHSANHTLHTKSENIHLEPSQASEGIKVPHAKRIRVGEPVAGHVLPLE